MDDPVPVCACVSSRWKWRRGGGECIGKEEGWEEGRRVHSRMKKVKQKGAELWVRRDTDTNRNKFFLFLFSLHSFCFVRFKFSRSICIASPVSFFAPKSKNGKNKNRQRQKSKRGRQLNIFCTKIIYGNWTDGGDRQKESGEPPSKVRWEKHSRAVWRQACLVRAFCPTHIAI